MMMLINIINTNNNNNKQQQHHQHDINEAHATNFLAPNCSQIFLKCGNRSCCRNILFNSPKKALWINYLSPCATTTTTCQSYPNLLWIIGRWIDERHGTIKVIFNPKNVELKRKFIIIFKHQGPTHVSMLPKASERWFGEIKNRSRLWMQKNVSFFSTL